MATSRPFGTIRKLSSGRYQARYWYLGKQHSGGTTFATKAAARAWLASVETALARGEHHDPAGGRVRYGEFARQWMEQRSLRPRTRETYESQLRHILAEFEGTELGAITPLAVRAWHGRLLVTGLHPNTVAKVYRLFRTTLETAVDDGMLRSNPVRIKGASAERAIERQGLDWDDVSRLAEVIEPRFSALVWTAATSALRFGELTGLTRAHVNLTERSLRVDQALAFERGRGATIGKPKTTAAHRTVIVPEFAADLLGAHLDAFVDRERDALVFTSLKGSPLLNRYFRPCWVRAKREAGVDESVRFHDLRHLAGTSAATAGASVREIMARMGHTTPDASLRYLKASERRDREIAQAIHERLAADLVWDGS